MKTPKKLSAVGAFLIALLTVGAVAGFAKLNSLNGARPEIKLALAGSVARNGKNIPVAEAGRVGSGEVIDWTISSVNSGKADAVSHDAVAQVPAGTSFVAGSARSEAGAVVSFSIDNGKSFSEQPMVDVRMQDGSVKQTAAPVSSYTNIKYSWNSSLAPAAERKATYKVSVK